MALSNKQQKFIRSHAQTIKSTVQIGKNDLNDATLKTIKDTLEANEIIKIHLLANASIEKDEVVEVLTNQLSLQYIYTIGNQIVVYKKSSKEMKQIFSKLVDKK